MLAFKKVPLNPMHTFTSINPQDLTHQEAYKLLIGSIVPRPIAWVSTQSEAGVLNLAPFSFFNGVCSNPPTITLGIVRRGTDNQKKDTLINLEATGQCVVHIATEPLADAMNQTSAEWPPEVDEFTQTGLTPLPSLKVAPPRIAQAPIAMECQLNQIITIGSGHDPGNGFLVIATVVYFHLSQAVYDGRYINTQALQPLSRLAGSQYARVTDTFSLPRPTL
jgi:flavin reductase (DIM6/NTAB) family NADH-FMN oxidoreductase RutF